MNANSHRIVRAFRLLWDEMGAARFYVAAAAVTLVVLAAVGLFKLISPAAVKPEPSPDASASNTPSPDPSREPATQRSVARTPVLTITDLDSRRRRMRDGARLVAARIGVAPQAKAEVRDVEIQVFFYDVTRDGELRPTPADVAYEWLTPERDWSNATPKYLVATYRRPRQRREGGERLRYGGYIVRVYANGQLQDERSEPEQILASLRAAHPPATTLTDADGRAPQESEGLATSSVQPTPTPSPEQPTAVRPSTPRPISPPPSTASTAPYGKPAPNKPGFIYSPHDERFIIDVRGVPPGTEITDPNTGKPLRVP